MGNLTKSEVGSGKSETGIMKDEKAELAHAALPVSLSEAQRLFSNLMVCG